MRTGLDLRSAAVGKDSADVNSCSGFREGKIACVSEEIKAESRTQKIIESAGPCVDVRGEVAPRQCGSLSIATHQQAKMGVEEQKEEREILDSIYPEEITGLNTKDCIFECLALTLLGQISQTQNSG